METFESLGLSQEILQAVTELGFSQPTEIQQRAIPVLLEGHDVLGQAQTGTGKTAAFGLPMISKIDPKLKKVQGLILAPTRELANQVCDAIEDFGKHSKIKAAPVYGGQSYTIQFRRLERKPHIVVGTPGRIIDLIDRKKLDLSEIKFLVLDEADEMLTMGFIEDVETIIGHTPSSRQTALFSATLTSSIRKLANKNLNDPKEIIIHRKKVTVDKIDQKYYLLSEKDKIPALLRLVEFNAVESGLIFTRTKIRTAELAEALIERNFSAEGLHGDMKQSMRERTMDRFKNKKIRFLVATDVAARGIDVDDITHVINFDVPYHPEEYVHRIGRTGRAGKSGSAITFITTKEFRRIKNIERYTKRPIESAQLPSIEDVQNKRDEQFAGRMVKQMTAQNYVKEFNLANQLVHWGYDPLDVAAAAIKLLNDAEKQTNLEEIRQVSLKSKSERSRPDDRYGKGKKKKGSPSKRKGGKRKSGKEAGMVRFRMELGKKHNIKPGAIVGAIANGAGIPGNAIGAIKINESDTHLDIAEEYINVVNRKMGNWKVLGKAAKLRPED